MSNGDPVTQIQSEADLDLLPDWLSTTGSSQTAGATALTRLAEILKKDHDDSWLSDFLHSASSLKANGLLGAAIRDNLVGKKESALKEALRAQRVYETVGNTAGILRSQLESIYSLRRQLKGRECRDRFSSVAPLFQGRNYLWLQTRISIEASGCVAMTNDFDSAWHIAEEAAEQARKANYPALQLRALGYLASFHTIEGRLSKSWDANQAGLTTFWSGTFPRDRAYQFYADLEFAAEKAEQWHVAAALQREAIEQFRESQRLDFRAAAHCRLARMEEMNGDIQKTREELGLSRQLFQELGRSSENALNEADCEVAWGSIEARYGDVDSALGHLAGIEQIVNKTKGFTIHLRYEAAWADLERRRGNWEQQQKHLQRAIGIGNKGFQTLKSPKDRWDWRREVGDAYRQLLQLEVEHNDDVGRAFADWELLRSIEMRNPVVITSRFIGDSFTRNLVVSRLKHLHDGTVVSFAVFPQFVNVWLADDRGIREFRIPVDSVTLTRATHEFYGLCANPHAPLKKVNDAGSRLYKLLVAPFEPTLDPTRTLFIEADQFLGLLPWPALLRTDGTYLGYTYRIVNTPGLLYRGSRRIRSPMEHILVAYPGAVQLDQELYEPLPQAKDEADYVASLDPHSTYLEGKQVTAEQLLKQLPGASTFHFAGHATTRAYGGELAVHGDTTGDVFSASRLTGMDLSRTRLIVLSACTTGGDPEAAHDPNGLVRAFLNAGGERVIATQWDVDSAATGRLMHDFYTAVKAGQGSERALQSAWKHVSSSSTTSHPYYWSSFQAFGAGNW